MTILEREDLSLAISQTPVAPALDLEEFLAKDRWKTETNYSERYRSILNQGRKFLQLALEGRAIGLSTLNEGKLGVDLPPIKAYLLSYRAYKQSQALNELGLETVLNKTDTVLSQILLHTTTGILPAQQDVEIARSFFRSMSTIPIESDE